MAFTEKPTVDSMRQTADHLGQLWSGCHRKWAEIDTYYNRTFKLWPEGNTDRPDWYKPMRSRSIVDHGVDRHLAHEPRIHRFPVMQNEARREKADKVEPALRAIMLEAALQEPSLTWTQAFKHLLLYGYSVVEDSLDADTMIQRRTKPKRMRGEPQEEFDRKLIVWEHKRKTFMPFRHHAPHPQRVLLDPMRKEPREAVRVDFRLAGDLEGLTRARMEGQQKGRRVEVPNGVYQCDNPYEQIECIEYWNSMWHGMTTKAGHLLFIEPNTWGFVPYSHAFSGYGQEPTNATEIDPSLMAVGLIDHARDDLRAQAQESAGRHNLALDIMFNPKVTSGEAMDLREQLARGDILEGFTQGQLWQLPYQSIPREVFASEEWIDRDLELGTFSRGLAGIREQGVSTVGQQAILSTAADRRFVSPATQVEHMASMSASHDLQLIDVLRLDLTVRGHNIKPSDIEGDYSVQVRFELIDPVLQLQNREMGLREVQAGVKSRETYWNADMQLEDAAGERRRLLKDLIRQDPAVQRLLAAAAAKEEGIDKLLQEMEDALSQGDQSNAIESIISPNGNNPNNSAGAGVNELNQALTPDVANPPQRGNRLAG